MPSRTHALRMQEMRTHQGILLPARVTSQLDGRKNIPRFRSKDCTLLLNLIFFSNIQNGERSAGCRWKDYSKCGWRVKQCKHYSKSDKHESDKHEDGGALKVEDEKKDGDKKTYDAKDDGAMKVEDEKKEGEKKTAGWRFGGAVKVEDKKKEGEKKTAEEKDGGAVKVEDEKKEGEKKTHDEEQTNSEAGEGYTVCNSVT